MKTDLYYAQIALSNVDSDFVLNKDEAISKFIRTVAQKVKMNILHGPVLQEGLPENPGITAFAIIDFSHISVHTFSKHNEVFVDIFSCKPFDYAELIAFIKTFFDTATIEHIAHRELGASK